jgi:hypothetical protein
MFERYTEGARRTIFFARYEASQLGSGYIETQHILLGLLREDKALFRRLLPGVEYESIHEDVVTHTRREGGKKPAQSSDLPLSNESKRVLAFGAEEAERLAHRRIGTEHLLLGLLREEKQAASRLLRDRGADIAKLRLDISKLPAPWFSGKAFRTPNSGNEFATVEIHDERWNHEYVREIVKAYRKFNWHWRRCAWKESDVVARISDGSISRDLSLAADSANFRLLVGGWTKDECLICRWELFRSEDDPEHGVGYTNGRDWMCTECYEKFWKGPFFFSSTYSEIT